MGSCIKIWPAPAVAVQDFLPPNAAPKTPNPADGSSSVCKKINFLFLSASWAHPVSISVVGVMGYPKKASAPAFKAAFRIASFPLISSINPPP